MKITKLRRSLTLLTAAVATGAAQGSGLPVFDKWNAVFNETSMLSNLANNVQLEIIRRQLQTAEEGTTVWKIDNSTTHIDKSTTNIDKSTKHIDKSTTDIRNFTSLNYDIDVRFKWIINNNGSGEEIIPIPYQEKLSKVMNKQDADKYSSHYRSLSDYDSGKATGHYGDATAVESSRARKAANDALVEAIAQDEAALNSEAKAIAKLAEVSNRSQGHGHQLQVANALAGSQINQLMKLRSMMLVSEAARAAEVQGAADRDARAVAVGKRMRQGLDTAYQQSMRPMPAPVY